MKKRLFLILCVVFLVAFTGSALADPIGPTCPNNSCNGGVYTLSYSGSPIATTATTSTYRITFTADTSALTIAAATMSDVAIKVSSAVVSVSLFSSPAGTWVVGMGGLNANGCSGSGAGFVCAQETAGTPNGVAVGGILTWVFDVEITNGLLNTNPLGAEIKGLFLDANGRKVGAVLSENITLQTPRVPEPSSLILALTGSALLLGARKLKLRR